MDTEHQHKKLLVAFRVKGALAGRPLGDSQRSVHRGRRRQARPALGARAPRRPPRSSSGHQAGDQSRSRVLVSEVSGKPILTYFKRLPAENRSSNHDEVDDLLLNCYNAFKEHRFPSPIELCGTSDALKAIVAAHSEDDLPLHGRCGCGSSGGACGGPGELARSGPSWTPRRGTSWTSLTFTSAFFCTTLPIATPIPPPPSS